MDIGITNRFLFWKFKRVEEFYVKNADVIIIYKLSGSSLFLIERHRGSELLISPPLCPSLVYFIPFLL